MSNKSKSKQELEVEMKAIVKKIDSIAGKTQPLQIVKIGGQSLNFYGSSEEFFSLLKTLQFGKFQSIKDDWMYDNCSGVEGVGINTHMQSFDESAEFDLEVGFKSREIFSQVQVREAGGLMAQYRKLSEEYEGLVEKEVGIDKKGKKQEENLPF